jgi:solute carrier family 25, member 38
MKVFPANNLFSGLLGLWKGTFPTVLRNVPGSSLYFVVLNSIRNAFHRLSPPQEHTRNDGVKSSSELIKLSHNFNLLAGASARVVAGLIVMPLTVVKSQYESTLYNYKSVPDAFKSIYKRNGIKGLFSGFGTTTLRDVPYAGLYVVFYEQGKESFRPVFENAVAVNLASSSSAGLLASVVTQPFDVIRTRVQVMPELNKNGLVSAKRIWQESGFKGFFAGLTARIVRKTFSVAITWTLYEELLKIIK